MLIAPVVSGVDGFVCMHEGSEANKRRPEETAVADKRRIGLLNIIQYVLAGVAVGAALAWNQYLVVPLVLSVAALPYAGDVPSRIWSGKVVRRDSKRFLKLPDGSRRWCGGKDSPSRREVEKGGLKRMT